MTLLIISACDYLNSKRQHWVPILAILCDGEKFEFMVYDSGVKSIYSSGMIAGVSDMRNDTDLLAPSLKRISEYIFDYFLMAYINGLRSFGHISELAAARSKSKKRKSTGKWMNALARAEHAHWLFREAAELARKEKFEEAEETARRGMDELKERLSLYVFIRYLITDECHDSVSEVQDMGLGGIPEFYDRAAVMHA